MLGGVVETYIAIHLGCNSSFIAPNRAGFSISCFYVAKVPFVCSYFCVFLVSFVSHSPFQEHCVPCLLILCMSHMCYVSFTMCQITLRPSTILCFHTLVIITASLSQHMGMDHAAA